MRYNHSKSLLYALLVSLGAMPACDDDEYASESVLDSPLTTREGEVDLSPPAYAVPGQWTHDEPVCGENAEELVAEYKIKGPKPPQGYDVPNRSQVCEFLTEEQCPIKFVSSTAELVAWTTGAYTESYDIILRDGIYQGNALPDADNDGFAYLAMNGGHRLWAATPGGAVLTFGIYAGGNPGAVVDPDDLADPLVARFLGPEFHGLVFDLPSVQYAALYDHAGVGEEQLTHDSALANWGLSRNMVVEDCWFHGSGLVRRGIYAAQTRGLQIRRVEVLDFARYGIFADRGFSSSTPIAKVDGPRIEDVAIHGIEDPLWSAQCPHTSCMDPDEPPPPNAYCPGTQEHGLWIGDDHTRVERLRVRDVGWAGVLSGDASWRVERTELYDIDVDDTGLNERTEGSGIAFERGNTRPVVDRFCVGSGSGRGIHAEWDHETFAGGSNGTNTELLGILHGFSRARHVGISLDKGVVHTRIYDVHIEDADVAGMAFHRNNLIAAADGPHCCTTTHWGDVTMANVSGCELTFSRYANPEPQPLLCPPTPNPSVQVCEPFPVDSSIYSCPDVLTCPA